MKILVSACLLGTDCKYNGGNNRNQKILDLGREHELIPVCPEMEGGLPCPRTPCEICQGKVVSANGTDHTAEYRLGAQKCLKKALEEQVDLAILQPRSPSCGVGEIYDGTFTGTLKPGDGEFVKLLKENNIPVMKPASF